MAVWLYKASTATTVQGFACEGRLFPDADVATALKDGWHDTPEAAATGPKKRGRKKKDADSVD